MSENGWEESAAAWIASMGDDGEVADPIKCAGWARQGLCAEGSTYAQFMSQHCSEQCEAWGNRDPSAGTPPIHSSTG